MSSIGSTYANMIEESECQGTDPIFYYPYNEITRSAPGIDRVLLGFTLVGLQTRTHSNGLEFEFGWGGPEPPFSLLLLGPIE